jgi:hypothetical protein
MESIVEHVERTESEAMEAARWLWSRIAIWFLLVPLLIAVVFAMFR